MPYLNHVFLFIASLISQCPGNLSFLFLGVEVGIVLVLQF
jgi:hypothetical protein